MDDVRRRHRAELVRYAGVFRNAQEMRECSRRLAAHRREPCGHRGLGGHSVFTRDQLDDDTVTRRLGVVKRRKPSVRMGFRLKRCAKGERTALNSAVAHNR